MKRMTGGGGGVDQSGVTPHPPLELAQISGSKFRIVLTSSHPYNRAIPTSFRTTAMFDEILNQIQFAKRIHALNEDPLTKSAITTLAKCLPDEQLDTQGAIAFKYVDKLRAAAAVLYDDPSYLEQPVTESWD